MYSGKGGENSLAGQSSFLKAEWLEINVKEITTGFKITGIFTFETGMCWWYHCQAVRLFFFVIQPNLRASGFHKMNGETRQSKGLK